MASGTQNAPAISDEMLARQFVEKHDASCFEELFVRHRRRIYFACRSFFESVGLAEDATQETFLRAYKNMHTFQGGSFCGWLMRIAKNVCIDEWRKRRPESACQEVAVENLPAKYALEHSTDLGLAVEKVRNELATLAPEQRRCLELTIDGYSYTETAALTGLSTKAVKSHVQNGRRMLWLRLEGILAQLR